MENKKLLIGLGVLAVAGIGYYIWKKNEGKEESKANMVDGGSGTTKGGWTKTKNKIKGVTNI